MGKCTLNSCQKKTDMPLLKADKEISEQRKFLRKNKPFHDKV